MRGLVIAVAVGVGWLLSGLVVAMVTGPQMRRSAAGLPFGHRNAPASVPAAPWALGSTAAARRRRHARGVVPAGLAAAVFVGSTGLAAAGALPSPVQGVAHTVLGSVGLSVPEVSDWSWDEVAAPPPSGGKQRAVTADDTRSEVSEGPEGPEERRRRAASTSEPEAEPVPEAATSTSAATVPTTRPPVAASISPEVPLFPRWGFRSRPAPTVPVTEPPPLEEPLVDPPTVEPPLVDPPAPTDPPVEGPPLIDVPPSGPPDDVPPPAGRPDDVPPPAGPPTAVVTPGGPPEEVGGRPGRHDRDDGG